ncbi:MAG: Do family serine endopeptidase AlgW [Candidatus Pelagadaptatus aseana]|uniref:trypsin-like peptidase domain-containing protein n=1 Tax=Candidatus Pelagadaptatus aseana TaxID=3120508 RepID=UPI0039B350A5
MTVKKLIDFLGWPVVVGLLLGVSVALWLQLEQKRELNAHSDGMHYASLSPSNGNWSGPVSYSEAVNIAAPAVVNIYTRKRSQQRRHPLLDDPLFRHFFNNSDLPQQERMQSALGTGVILSRDGYIVTNNHVIEGAEEILALTYDGREARATKIGSDSESDLAVLKIELDNITPIKVGNPDSARVGDVVLAIGNPFGVGQTVTQGIVSATGRYGLGINTYENFIQTDAAINPGNSGGALIDAHGNLLGINTAILDKTGFSVGIGFAIPADIAVSAMQDLIKYGKVVRGWLGVEAQQITPELAQSFRLDSTDGVIITAIYNNGPAHQAGIRPGDIIIKLNDLMVKNGLLSMNKIARGRPGDKVDVIFLRKGEQHNTTATLGIKPDLQDTAR